MPQVYLPHPHPGQIKILKEQRRFNWLSAGRGYWKTSMMAGLALTRAFKGQEILWGAPTYDQVNIGLEYVLKAGGPAIKHIKSRDVVQCPNNGRIIFRSFDNPDTKRGFHPDGAILDECGELLPEVLTDIVMPAIGNKEGWIWGIGTPKGFNWFYREWKRGQPGPNRDPNVASWQAPALGVKITDDGLIRCPHPLENPYIKFQEILNLYNRSPYLSFCQEALAEFLESGGNLFPHIDECAVVTPGSEQYIPGHTYVIGVDIGKSIDFTVIQVIDLTERKHVHQERFTGLSFPTQLGRMEVIFREWRPLVIQIEANNAGWPFIHMLQDIGYPVQAFETSHLTRKLILDQLIQNFGCKTIKILDDEQLKSELRLFQPVKLPGGSIKYEIPREEGNHDDCVLALAIGWHAVEQIGDSWAAKIQIEVESVSIEMLRDVTSYLTFVKVKDKFGDGLRAAGATVGVWNGKFIVLDVQILSLDTERGVKFLLESNATLAGCDKYVYEMIHHSWKKLTAEASQANPFFSLRLHTLVRDEDLDLRQLQVLSGLMDGNAIAIHSRLRGNAIIWRELFTPRSAALDAVAGAVQVIKTHGPSRNRLHALQ